VIVDLYHFLCCRPRQFVYSFVDVCNFRFEVNFLQLTVTCGVQGIVLKIPPRPGRLVVIVWVLYEVFLCFCVVVFLLLRLHVFTEMGFFVHDVFLTAAGVRFFVFLGCIECTTCRPFLPMFVMSVCRAAQCKNG